MDLDEEIISLPRKLRWQLILSAPTRWRIKLRALYLGVTPYDVLWEQTKIRWEQFGGMQMPKWLYEDIFLNEMPTDEFIDLMMHSGPPIKKRKLEKALEQRKLLAMG